MTFYSKQSWNKLSLWNWLGFFVLFELADFFKQFKQHFHIMKEQF